MKKLGIIVNPVAGMGGRVGLKGSDGAVVLRKAKELGAQPESPRRTVQALCLLSEIKGSAEFMTYPAEMGEAECREAGLTPRVLGSIRSSATSAEDTRKAAQQMRAEGVDLLLFAGGDGTARDIYQVLQDQVPVLGIPAGVKIHSGVFAVNPRSAGELVAMFLGGRRIGLREAEVMDIDEEAFRQGVLTARLYGYLRVPEGSRYVQSVKAGGGWSTETEALRGIASDVAEMMNDPDCCFILGPGTTPRAVTEALGLEKTLLGIDVVRNRQLMARDVAEEGLLKLIDGQKAKIVVTVIGGQGHVFGRGNHQISPRVIRAVGRENVIVIATKAKLASLAGRPLLFDTGDAELDRELSGYFRVTTGYSDYVMYKAGY